MLLLGEMRFPEEDDLVLEERPIDGVEVEVGIPEVNADDLRAQGSGDSSNLHAVLP